MSESTDWKEKCRGLLKKQEADATEWEETERLLCRTIMRLTLVADGINPTLDPHLNRLREAVRKGVDEDLKRDLGALTDALIRAKEEPAAETEEAPKFDLIPRLIARAAPSGRATRRLAALGERLSADPGNVTDSQLDELLNLLVSESAPSESEKGPGLFQRLFQSGASDDASAPAPGRLLYALIDGLEWPGYLRPDIESLKERLEQASEPDGWTGVVEELFKLLLETVGSVRSEMQATEGFLEDLTSRLQELDQHVSGSQAAHEASIRRGRDFSRAMDDEVVGIRSTVSTATDLEQLKTDIVSRLDTIQHRVDEHIKSEEKRQRDSEESEQILQRRLKVLEEEAGSLRNKMIEAHSRALQDALTGLPNRAAYEERMGYEYARWKRFQSPLVLVVWDIDDFKRINDRFGHQAGDKTLRVVGKILRQRPRETDFVGRYGGEEFVMLLPGATIDDALQIGNEIRKAVAESGFRSGSKPVSVTISCGISLFREGDTPESVFKRADTALYAAKKEGKNRCVVR